MNILQMVSSQGLYGAERMMVELSRSLNKKGHQSIIADLSDDLRPNKQLTTAAAVAGVTTIRVACNGRLDLGALSRIRDAVRLHDIDVIHTHGYKPDVHCWLASRGHAKPIVATCHNWIASDAKGKIYGVIDRIVLRWFDACVGVSAEIAGILTSCGTERTRISVIHNGIDPVRFEGAKPSLSLPFPSGTIVAGFVGRLSPEKNCEALVLALARLANAEPNVAVVFVGEGPEEAQLLQLAAKLGVSHKVYFAGRRDDMAGVYASIDLLVLPSSTEGLPLVLLEAMSAAKPVIASRVGEIPAVVRHRQSGLLVSPGDIGELAECLRLLAENSTLRERLSVEARARILGQFTADRMADDYEALYYDAICQINARSTPKPGSHSKPTKLSECAGAVGQCFCPRSKTWFFPVYRKRIAPAPRGEGHRC